MPEVMPAAKLEQCDSDVAATDEQLLQLSLFAQLKSKPNLEKFPGTLVVRFFKKGDLICRQGEAGWTAFYILTSADVLALRTGQLQSVRRDNERRALQAEIFALQRRVELLKALPPDDDRRTAAMVYLAVANPPDSSKVGKAPVEKTLFIPVDGPVTLNYDSLRAPLKEGELFGEMSCQYRSPRSATIVARRDCYMVEMLRNVLDQIQRDKNYKARMDDVYKKRVLDLHLRKLSLFAALSDDEFQRVRDSVELVSYDPGALICDEHDRSDCLYIVRSGLVKVQKNVSALLSVDHVMDWPTLCNLLHEGDSESEAKVGAPSERARGKLWQMLPEDVRNLVRGTAQRKAGLEAKDESAIVLALNDLLKSPQFIDTPEFQPYRDAPFLREQVGEPLARHQAFAAKKSKEDWSEQDARRCHRLLLEAMLPGALRHLSPRGGPDWVLSYCARGEYFGEMGLILNRPRSASCIAFGHPNDYGQVELVRVPGKTFWQLLKTSPRLKAKVEQEVQLRRKQNIQHIIEAPEARKVQYSKQFEQLGLIQGQKLMLIDLDRCTRCDECVRACVNTHDDGRTRLFLDGPRFGKYLVPTTCRSCLDPVCLIGCPVGSIHRGDNREIIIENWCIGCELCAKSCPYGSIQMHDLGIIPENARGWRFLPAAAVSGDRWRRPGFRDEAWQLADAPVYLDRELREQLAQCQPRGVAPSASVCFRYEFRVARAMLADKTEFKLVVVSQASSVQVWLNGQAVVAEGKPKRGCYEYALPQPLPPSPYPLPPLGGEGRVRGGASAGRKRELHLMAGANVLAVEVAATTDSKQELLQARLDKVCRPELPADVDEKEAAEIRQKLVMLRAVVCDLCSTLPGQKPACVNACPHDAALRVNARFAFPQR